MASFLDRRQAQLRAQADGAPTRPQQGPSRIDEAVVAQLADWFATYSALKNIYAPGPGGPYSCPCCGHRTLTERGGYEICAECGWEDDGQDDHDAHIVRAGPNGLVSLAEARAAYVQAGGTPQQHVPPAAPT